MRSARLVLIGVVVLTALLMTAVAVSTHADGPPLDLVAIDTVIEGNTATSVGTAETCNTIAAVGDTLEIDAVVKGVPPYDPVTDSGAIVGFQFNLLYDPAVVNVTAYDPEMMLAADPDSILIDVSDPVPDWDGDWVGAAADAGKREASGDGVLMRITLEAVGEGTSALDLSGVIVAGHPGDPYPLGSILGGVVSVGETCDPDWTPTPAPPPTPTPTPAPTPTPPAGPTPTPPPTPPPAPPLPEIEVDIDMDTAGNTATSVGTVETCNSMGAVGDTLEIDAVVKGVPPYDPITNWGALPGFQFNLLYDPAVVNVTAYDPEMLLAAGPDSVVLDLSDAVPDGDGDWLGAAADVGEREASGDGVLIRITLQAVGEGTSALSLDGVMVVGFPVELYPITGSLEGEIVVGGTCSDRDGDGFTDPEEGFVGTDAADDCPDDMGDDAWPADMASAEGYGEHDGTVNVLDIVQLTPPYFDTTAQDPEYSERKDFNGDAAINVLDIVRLTPPVFNTSCQ